MYSFKFCFIITNIGMLNVQLLIGQNSDQLHDTIVILYNLVSLLKCTIRVETCSFRRRDFFLKEPIEIVLKML
jgi:hypothetical protein